nr:hypothetical protein BaRGS_022699 [Batillaria attramentaria]
MTSEWQFYSQTGICIPLPVSEADFAGHSYSFSVMVVLNFVLFLFIALGQVSIFLSVRSTRSPLRTTSQKSKDLTIARRLITVAVSDFLCWFPIGVLGIRASSGAPIPAGQSTFSAEALETLGTLIQRSKKETNYTFNHFKSGAWEATYDAAHYVFDKLTETFEVSFKYLHMIGQFKDSLANQNECQLRPGLCPNVTACTKGLESVTMKSAKCQPSPLPNAIQCESNCRQQNIHNLSILARAADELNKMATVFA